MENNDRQPETKPAGNKPPPKPPHRAGIGIGPDDYDSNKKGPATITKSTEGEGKFIRLSGGKQHYGHVKIKIQPNGKGKGIQIISDIIGDAIPAEYVKHVIRGVYDELNGCIDIGDPTVDGHKVADVVVRLIDGSSREVESSQIAFKMAGMLAVKDALKKADLVVIE